MGINHSRFHIVMPGQFLNNIYISTCLYEVGKATMPQ